MAPFSRMFRPPSGSAMLILLLVVRTTSKPVLSSASVTSWRVFSSPDEAKASNPCVMACAASCFASGRAAAVTSARRFSGAFGSCSPSRPLTTVCQASMRGRSARSKYGCRRLPVRSSVLGIRKFSSRRPLSVCSTHRTLYWSLSSPGIRTRSKLAISFSRCPGGRSASANDSTPEVYFFAYGEASISSRTSSGRPCRTLAPSRCRSFPSR